MRIKSQLFLVIISLIIFGCTPKNWMDTTPYEYLPTSQDSQADTYGGWIEVKYQDSLLKRNDSKLCDPYSKYIKKYKDGKLVNNNYKDNYCHEFSGELIAMNVDSVFILSKDQLSVISKARIFRAKLGKYDASPNSIFKWGLRGSLTTPTHGFFLGFTFPAWIIMGTFYSKLQFKNSILIYEPLSKTHPKEFSIIKNIPLEDFVSYARFPQGLPSTLKRAKLRSKLKFASTMDMDPREKKIKKNSENLRTIAAGILFWFTLFYFV